MRCVVAAIAAIILFGPSAAAAWTASHPGTVHPPKVMPTNFGSTWQVYRPNGVDAWAIPPTTRDAPVIVMVHGYRQPRSDLRELANHLHDRNYGIVLIELAYLDGSEPYSGGGHEARSVCQAVSWARNMFHHRVVLAGYSAGGFASSLAVGNGCVVSALITDSAFVDAASTFRHAAAQRTHLPKFAFFALRPAYFIASGGGSLRNVRAHTRRWITPTFIIHGAADTYVPPRNAKQLHAVTAGKVWLVKGANHGQAWYKGPTEYENRVDSFIRNALHAR